MAAADHVGWFAVFALLGSAGTGGCDPVEAGRTGRLMLLLFAPQIALYGVGIVLTGVLQAHRRFLAAAIEGDEAQHFIVLTALIAGLAAPGANLSSDTASDVVPQAFAFTVGSEGGLEVSPPDYFP